MKRKTMPLGDLIRGLLAKGITEALGFSGRHGLIYFDLEQFRDSKAPAYITPKGYIKVNWHGDGFETLGQI